MWLHCERLFGEAERPRVLGKGNVEQEEKLQMFGFFFSDGKINLKNRCNSQHLRELGRLVH